MSAKPLIIRRFGRQAYAPVLTAMQRFTLTRDHTTVDELWCLEHEPVFTQGLNGRPEHLLAPGTIPVIKSDRGGQITYHGPGQVVVYVLLDIRRAQLGVRELVSALEQAAIKLLNHYHIEAYARADAPGVYVQVATPGAAIEKKIASLGLRVRRGCSYHGLSVNVAMELAPFQRINPCGHAGLMMTQLSELSPVCNLETVMVELPHQLAELLQYTVIDTLTELPQT